MGGPDYGKIMAYQKLAAFMATPVHAAFPFLNKSV